jgi:hypothetical protein
MAKWIQDGNWLGGFEALGMVTFIHDIQVALGIGGYLIVKTSMNSTTKLGVLFYT